MSYASVAKHSASSRNNTSPFTNRTLNRSARGTIAKSLTFITVLDSVANGFEIGHVLTLGPIDQTYTITDLHRKGFGTTRIDIYPFHHYASVVRRITTGKDETGRDLLQESSIQSGVPAIVRRADGNQIIWGLPPAVECKAGDLLLIGSETYAVSSVTRSDVFKLYFTDRIPAA